MTRLSRCRMIWPPTPFSRSKQVFLFVVSWLTDGRWGEAPNHDGEKVWSCINHSILSGSTSLPQTDWITAIGVGFLLPCRSGFTFHFFHDAPDPPFHFHADLDSFFTSMKLRIHLFTSMKLRIRLFTSTIRESPTLASTALFWASLAPGKSPWLQLHCEPQHLPAFHIDKNTDPDYHVAADPDTAFHFDANPDPASQFRICYDPDLQVGPLSKNTASWSQL